MHKIIIAAIGATVLSGCTAVVSQPVMYQQRPVLYNPPVYSNYQYQQPYPIRPHYPTVARHPNCFMTWDRTPYGMRERRICR